MKNLNNSQASHPWNDAKIKEIRQLFPITKTEPRRIFLQSAAISPMPERTLKSLINSYQRAAELGDIFFEDDLRLWQEIRTLWARWTKLSPEQNDTRHFAITPSTSHSMNMIAQALKEKGVRSLVSLKDEFPSSTIPFEAAGIVMNYLEPDESGAYSVSKILEYVTESNADGVVCSHIQYGTGFRLDIEKLGRELRKIEHRLDTNKLLIVNGTQAFPYFAPDLREDETGIDVYVASLHKWSMTGHVGAMLYTSADFRKTYPNPQAGWLSIVPHAGAHTLFETEKNVGIERRPDGEQFYLGTSNLRLMAPLLTSYQLMEELGLDSMRERVLALANYLVEQFEQDSHLRQHIRPLFARADSPIVSLKLMMAEDGLGTDSESAAVAALAKELIAENIFVSERQDRLRISLNIFNTEEEIDVLIKKLNNYF